MALGEPFARAMGGSRQGTSHGGEGFTTMCPGPVPQLYIYIYIYIYLGNWLRADSGTHPSPMVGALSWGLPGASHASGLPCVMFQIVTNSPKIALRVLSWRALGLSRLSGKAFSRDFAQYD